MLKKNIAPLALGLLVLAISAVRCALFVETATGYDNGPLAPLSWVASVVLAAAAAALLWRSSQNESFTVCLPCRVTGALFLISGICFLFGTLTLVIAKFKALSAAASVVHILACAFGVVSGVVLIGFGAFAFSGKEIKKFNVWLLAVPCFGALRVIFVFFTMLLNAADTLNVLSIASAIFASYACVVCFSSVLVSREEKAVRSAALPAAMALFVCVSLALPAIPPLFARGAVYTAAWNLGDAFSAIGAFFAVYMNFYRNKIVFRR